MGMVSFSSFLAAAAADLHVPRLKLVDVGALSLGGEPYAPLWRALPCELIGFEPTRGECEKLNREAAPGQRFLPYFIGDGSRQRFFECNAPMTSSLFEPDGHLLHRFQNLENFTRVIRTHDVETKRLDDIAEVRGTDYLKVDVQGGELLVYQGAIETLKDVLVIHSEVCFVPLYKRQPLFADIDTFLRGQGFAFHRFAHTSGRTFKPLVAGGDLNAPMSQTLWGDAVYVRDFTAFEELSAAALLKLAAILHENYRSYDLAAVALEAHDRLTGSALQPAYVERLTAASSG